MKSYTGKQRNSKVLFGTLAAFFLAIVVGSTIYFIRNKREYLPSPGTQLFRHTLKDVDCVQIVDNGKLYVPGLIPMPKVMLPFKLTNHDAQNFVLHIKLDEQPNLMSCTSGRFVMSFYRKNYLVATANFGLGAICGSDIAWPKNTNGRQSGNLLGGFTVRTSTYLYQVLQNHGAIEFDSST